MFTSASHIASDVAPLIPCPKEDYADAHEMHAYCPVFEKPRAEANEMRSLSHGDGNLHDTFLERNAKTG